MLDHYLRAGSFLQRPALAVTGDPATVAPPWPGELNRAHDLFLDMLANVPLDGWSEYIERVCAGNAGLEHQLGRLLQAHRESDSPSTTPADIPPIRARIGKYKLLQQLGEG